MSKAMRGLLYVALTIALLACASSPGAALPTPTPDLGAEYLQLVAPTNAALDQLYTAYVAQPPDSGKIRPAVQAMFDADVKFSTALLAFEKKVPASVQAHVEAARAAVSKDIADLQLAIGSTDDAGLLAALNVWSQDARAESSAFVLLRSDLGLPPPSNIGPSPTPSKAPA